jgi:hypothetical protein
MIQPMRSEGLTSTFFDDAGLNDRYAILMSRTSPVEKVKPGME